MWQKRDGGLTVIYVATNPGQGLGGFGGKLGYARALVAVNFGMAADIQQSYVLIVAPFREDNPQIVINGCCPFSAHLACEGMIAQGWMEGVFLKQLDRENYRCFVGRRQLTK